MRYTKLIILCLSFLIIYIIYKYFSLKTKENFESLQPPKLSGNSGCYYTTENCVLDALTLGKWTLLNTVARNSESACKEFELKIQKDCNRASEQRGDIALNPFARTYFVPKLPDKSTLNSKPSGCYIATNNCSDSYWGWKANQKWFNDEVDGVKAITSEEECNEKRNKITKSCQITTTWKIKGLVIGDAVSHYVPPNLDTLFSILPQTPRIESSPPGCYRISKNCYEDDGQWKKGGSASNMETCKAREEYMKDTCATRSFVKTHFIPNLPDKSTLKSNGVGCYIATTDCKDEYWFSKSQSKWFNHEVDGGPNITSEDDCNKKKKKVSQLCMRTIQSGDGEGLLVGDVVSHFVDFNYDPKCKDRDPTCKSMKQKEGCSSNSKFMSKNCAKSCGTCSKSLNEVLGPIIDYDNVYKRIGLTSIKIDLEERSDTLEDTELFKEIILGKHDRSGKVKDDYDSFKNLYPITTSLIGDALLAYVQINSDFNNSKFDTVKTKIPGEIIKLNDIKSKVEEIVTITNFLLQMNTDMQPHRNEQLRLNKLKQDQERQNQEEKNNKLRELLIFTTTYNNKYVEVVNKISTDDLTNLISSVDYKEGEGNISGLYKYQIKQAKDLNEEVKSIIKNINDFYETLKTNYKDGNYSLLSRKDELMVKNDNFIEEANTKISKINENVTFIKETYITTTTITPVLEQDAINLYKGFPSSQEISDLDKQISNLKRSPIYNITYNEIEEKLKLIYGEDSFLSQTTIEEVRNKLVSLDFNKIKYEITSYNDILRELEKKTGTSKFLNPIDTKKTEIKKDKEELVTKFKEIKTKVEEIEKQNQSYVDKYTYTLVIHVNKYKEDLTKSKKALEDLIKKLNLLDPTDKIKSLPIERNTYSNYNRKTLIGQFPTNQYSKILDKTIIELNAILELAPEKSILVAKEYTVGVLLAGYYQNTIIALSNMLKELTNYLSNPTEVIYSPDKIGFIDNNKQNSLVDALYFWMSLKIGSPEYFVINKINSNCKPYVLPYKITGSCNAKESTPENGSSIVITDKCSSYETPPEPTTNYKSLFNNILNPIRNELNIIQKSYNNYQGISSTTTNRTVSDLKNEKEE